METGIPVRTIAVIVKAAARATVKAPPKASTLPKRPKVPEGPLPSKTAPKKIKMDAIKAAVLNFSILVSTAAPKILPVSLAPKDQPKKRPLSR
ncbi:MAG: hypothetical protein BWX46_00729 [Candidatus Cloacimonetes bacterium ADurb.Bin003]|nr:MAG: hypothetical protein BWX46_00729 [Candidatus Cloacimonetes bacterium ADurb.Bin003]